MAPVGTLLTPARTFHHLAHGPPGRGLAPVVVLALAWGLLSLSLGLMGQAPSGPVPPPFPAESYYFWQAAFLPILLPALWKVHTWTTAWLARTLVADRAPSDDVPALGNVLGYAFSVPVSSSLVLPDVLILWTLGFEKLSSAMMYYAPLTLLWTLSLCTLATRTVYGAGWIRAVTSALGGLMALAMVGALWIR